MNHDAQWMADLHAECFTTPRPWSAGEFTALLGDPNIICIPVADGFLLARTVADEAELLTICIRPTARRLGIASALLGEFIAAASAAGAARCFLEVSADNAAAIALYRGFGFEVSGRRPDYYRPPAGDAADALVLRRDLT